MLSYERIIDIADDFESQYMHGGITFDDFDSTGFARAIEREATAPLIEQIKEDEALMRQVLSWISATDPQHAWSVEGRSVEALRQRLEAKK